ncbi:hypothetical protein NBT05_07310 [Aquimarina sp. ERC-38]|uniref:hypothetical protein n=1 Tax=Aquimarina sp. ERC-38 TaxID=2949996 RepID=UPI002245AA26|nr:hypothetical protein [Aquimarina sp. ERC-38]UZO82276.1 hypothetical protein NBT05_07310 [Aquimarina sp. ERC-38]
MKHFLFLLLLLLFVNKQVTAQNVGKTETLAILNQQLDEIKEEEKQNLKVQINNINSLLDNGVIGVNEANRLKMQAAEKTAKKIEERQTYLRQAITHLNGSGNTVRETRDSEIFSDIDTYFDKRNSVSPAKPQGYPQRPPVRQYQYPQPARGYQYQQPIQRNQQIAPIGKKKLWISTPTSVDLVLAGGLSNTIREEFDQITEVSQENIEDERYYDLENSRFFEFGFALKTPLVRRNGIRIKYGLSYQTNILAPNGNRYFAERNGLTQLRVANEEIRRSRFVVNNLVVPIHFEIGSTRLKQTSESNYYSTKGQLKIGFGGYAGFNVHARQTLQTYERNRGLVYLRRQYIDGYDVNRYIYGLSAYIGVGGFSIYGKYDLNTIFNNGVEDERFVSVGLRFDL